MEKYKNLSTNSSVTHYEIGDDFILVKFQDKMVYRYTHIMPGIMHVNKMKDCAKAGFGLNSYINKYVKKDYADKYQAFI